MQLRGRSRSRQPVPAIEFRMMRLRRYGAALYGTRTAESWEDEEDKSLTQMYEKRIKHKDMALRLNQILLDRVLSNPATEDNWET